ncbi:MAG TPA: CPBP family intramembrane glutamic endopeptidase [Rhodanobacteraceae bacterium]|nr:CPBP family intramembrane glutamic endopeptidase [Rhodanobacteraceae bacterium]
MTQRWRALIVFAVLFLLYQSAEGVGDLLLHNFTVQATLMVACVLAAWPLSHWLGWKGYGAYVLGWGPVRAWGWLVGGMVLALLGKLGAIVVGLKLDVYASATGSVAWAPLSATALPMLLVGTFVPSVAEDILTRGFWYRAAGIHWQRGLMFVLFSAVMYLLNHIYRLQLGPTEWLLIFCYGLAYAAALWRSGSLWAAVGLHWGWNLANGVLDVDTLDPERGSLLSTVVHVVILGIVLLLPRSVRPETR